MSNNYKTFLVTHDADKDMGIIFAESKSQAIKIGKICRVVKGAHYSELNTTKDVSLIRVIGYPSMLTDLEAFLKATR